MSRLRRVTAATTTALLVTSLAVAGAVVPASPAAAATGATLYVLTGSGSLLTVDSAAPGTATATVAVTGLATGERLVGIDTEPSTGLLLGVSTEDKLYAVDPTSGAARQRGSAAFTPSVGETGVGLDVNPASGVVRVVADSAHVRLAPASGTALAAEPVVTFAAGDRNAGRDADASALAYTLPSAGAPVLYGLDTRQDTLVRLDDPNTGVAASVGTSGLGIDVSQNNGFDIAAQDATAYAALRVTDSESAGLYTINLTTGRATSVGALPGVAVVGLAVESPGQLQLSAPGYGTTEGVGTLRVPVSRQGGDSGAVTVSYTTSNGSATAPGDFALTSGTLTFAEGATTASIPITIVKDTTAEVPESFTVTLSAPSGGAGLGTRTSARVVVTDEGTAYTVGGTGRALGVFALASPSTLDQKVVDLPAGEQLRGIDVRPLTGALYGLTSADRLVLLDPSASPVTVDPIAAPLALPGSSDAVRWGFDFNPTVDRLRLVNTTNDNLRVNPALGTVVDADPATPTVDQDGDLRYGANDTNVGAEPGVAAVAYTENRATATTTTLFGLDSRLDVLVRQEANSGVLSTVGPLGVDAAPGNGFDIAPDGTAYAALALGTAEQALLYRVNLTSGATTAVGALGTTGAPTQGLAVALDPAAATPPPPPPAAVTASVSLSSSPQITAGNTPELSGVVRDAAGAGLAGKTVIIFAREYATDSYRNVATATTDANGRYALRLAPKTQTIFIAAVREPGREIQSARFTMQVNARIDIRFPTPGARVVGQTVRVIGVYSPAGPVNVGLYVVRDGRFTFIGRGVTDASGRFDVSANLPAGFPPGEFALNPNVSPRLGVLRGSRSVGVVKA